MRSTTAHVPKKRSLSGNTHVAACYKPVEVLTPTKIDFPSKNIGFSQSHLLLPLLKGATIDMCSEQSERNEALVMELKKCELTEQGLRGGIAAIAAANGARQDLLYLHGRSTSLSAELLGMSLVEGGKEVVLSPDPEKWLYQSVLDAINEGWRVISFPDQSLLTMSDEEFHGLGFLFILERWR